MTKVKCPYCNNTQEEPNEAYIEDEMYMAECIECKKIFGVTPYYVKGYYEYKMPCENGEPHKWIQIIGSPSKVFANRIRCEYCGEETTKDKIGDAKF